MIVGEALREAVEIQQRSYRLIRWLAKAVQGGVVRFDQAHRFATEAEPALNCSAELILDAREELARVLLSSRSVSPGARV